ncbi:MAG: alpha/beta hydrolase [Oscillospiraceae bacterium]|nr:alpha/beta hydrolase [Oscillospiraceae bacterium]
MREAIKEIFVHPMQRVPGVLYEPEETAARNRIAVLVMHSDEDYLTFCTGRELAKRGFCCLCANMPCKEGFFWTQPEKMPVIDGCVRFLRNLQGVEKVILMGHSGGATTMSAYQAIAENGVSVFQGKEKILPHPDTELLLPADGVMLLDPNFGNAYCQLCSLDPAIVDEQSGKNMDVTLDLYAEENGFRENGCSYSEEFINRFMAAQSARNMRVLNHALERFSAIQQGAGAYDDDETITIPGGAQGFFNNKEFVTRRHLSHTAAPQKLLHADGSITLEPVQALQHSHFSRSYTASHKDGARITTVKTYLTSYAVRTFTNYGSNETSIWGIDWSSTYNSPVPNMEHVSCPVLITGMTAGVNPVQIEIIYNHTASKDKDLVYIEGADHLFCPAAHLEAFPGQFGDTMKLHHDYIAGWLSYPGRFL